MTQNGTHHQLALPVILQQGGGDWRRVYWRTNPSFRPACFTWRREYWRNTSSSFGPAGFTFAWMDWLLLHPKGGLLICRLAVWWGLPINLYDQWSLISHPILIMINVATMNIYSTHNHWPWPLMILVISMVWSETIVISDDGWSSYHICSNIDPPPMLPGQPRKKTDGWTRRQSWMGTLGLSGGRREAGTPLGRIGSQRRMGTPRGRRRSRRGRWRDRRCPHSCTRSGQVCKGCWLESFGV